MSFLQWKRFQFFEKDLLKPTQGETDVPDFGAEGGDSPSDELAAASNLSAIDKIRELSITCTTSGRGHIYAGDSDGIVHRIDKQLKISSFRCYDVLISHIIHVSQTSFLITVGVDDHGGHPLVKFWNLDKWIPHEDGMKPHCTRVIRPSPPGSNPTPIICLSANESLSFMAIGLADGTLNIHRGDITRDKFSKSKTIKVSDAPITGVAFGDKYVGDSQQLSSLLPSPFSPSQSYVLFVSTTKQVLSYILRADKEVKFTLDDTAGADVRCSCIMSDVKRGGGQKLFVVARKDAVYFYQSDERGPCLVFEGEKQLITTFRNYLIIVGKEKAPIPSTLPPMTPMTPQALFMSTPPATYSDNEISIYDLDNKFIAFSSMIPGISEVIGEWGSLYVLTRDGKIFKLMEKDINTKLELLFRKSQYSLAVDLAKSCNFDSDQMAEISKHYADFLYKKGDYDSAITQYCKTIGVLEPSYVIRKFLDSSRILNLTHYIQELLVQGFGSEDHTTLLINCFAKLKDAQQLNNLTSEDSSLNVDIETAIKVLRNANFLDHAARLASRHDKHDWYLRIQLEDKDDAAAALTFLQGQVRESERLCLLIKYGRLLLEKEADRTTTFAIQLTCRYLQDTSIFSMTTSTDAVDPLDPSFLDFNLDDLLNIFILNKSKMLVFLESVIDQYPSTSPPSFYHTLLGLYLRRMSNPEVEEEQRKQDSQKTIELLQRSGATYDIDHAIILCSTHGFDDGLLYLFIKGQKFSWILQHHISKKNDKKVTETCKSFGHLQPLLFVDALWFYADNHDVVFDEQDITFILKEIEKRNLLPGMMIVKILSQNPNIPLSVLSGFLSTFLTSEISTIQENSRQIDHYKDDTEKMRQLIEELKSQPKVFQARKCSCCNKELELPTVHFYCGHSYHQACFESYSAEHDSECPLCLPENTKLLSEINRRLRIKDQSQRLKDQLSRSDTDIFSVISSFLSKGLLNEQQSSSKNPHVRK